MCSYCWLWLFRDFHFFCWCHIDSYTCSIQSACKLLEVLIFKIYQLGKNKTKNFWPKLYYTFYLNLFWFCELGTKVSAGSSKQSLYLTATHGSFPKDVSWMEGVNQPKHLFSAWANKRKPSSKRQPAGKCGANHVVQKPYLTDLPEFQFPFKCWQQHFFICLVCFVVLNCTFVLFERGYNYVQLPVVSSRGRHAAVSMDWCSALLSSAL